MEQGRVCQFYIVLGDKEFRPPNDGNVYINATGVMDNKLIWDSISRAFSKKSSERIAIANKILFLVPDVSFQDRCNEIMNALRIKGEVHVYPIKKEVIVPEKVVEFEPKVEEEQQKVEEIASPVQQPVSKSADIVDIQEYQMRLQQKNQGNIMNSNREAMAPKEESFKYSYRPENNIYRGELDIPLNGNGNIRGSNDTGMQMTYNQGKGKTLVKKPTKSAAFVSLPVIIFVLSTLLLIASVVLLFVVE